jgi:spore coat protein U-like protein
VLDVCAVTATPLAFGNYTATASSPTDAQSTVNVTCAAGLGYSIALNQGSTSGATVDDRAMSDGGSNTLSYGLYSDSGHSTLWGDGTASTSVVGPETGDGTAQGHTVYGRIPAGQFVASGGYTDTVTVTVTY